MKKILQLKLNHRYFTYLGAISLALLFMVSFVDPVSAQKPNFSGSWVLNPEKSDMGQPPAGGGPGPGGPGGGGRGFGAAARNMDVKQDANNLSIDQQMGRPGEERTVTIKYTLDGKESVNNIGRGTSKSIAKWSADAKSLNIASTMSVERDGQMRETKSNAVWTLTDGGKTLTINSTTSTPNGERKLKRVYDKK